MTAAAAPRDSFETHQLSVGVVRGGVLSGLNILLGLAWGRISSFLALFLTIAFLGATGQLPVGEGSPSASGMERDGSWLPGSEAAAHGQPEVQSNDASVLGDQFEASESEKEEYEDGHSKGLVSSTLSSGPVWRLPTCEGRPWLAVDALVARIGAYRELPRGPPSQS